MRLAIVALLAGCGKEAPSVTREQCAKVADHIATVIIDHYASHPEELWEGMADPYETGVPKSVTKDSFKPYLASPEGKTWLMQRHGQVRSSAEAGIEPCVTHGTPSLVRCLLATKTREDVEACDRANPSRNAPNPQGSPPPANPAAPK